MTYQMLEGSGVWSLSWTNAHSSQLHWIALPSPGPGKFPGCLRTGGKPLNRCRVTAPEGLPNLRPRDQARVDTDNAACKWVLCRLQKAAESGRGGLRENPARSLHWSLPQEQEMLAAGLWLDTEYSASAFASARAKAQRLRHNIQEIAAWGPLQCMTRLVAPSAYRLHQRQFRDRHDCIAHSGRPP